MLNNADEELKSSVEAIRGDASSSAVSSSYSYFARQVLTPEVADAPRGYFSLSSALTPSPALLGRELLAKYLGRQDLTIFRC